MKKDGNTQEEINIGSQEGNVAPDGPQYVTAMANPATVQESDGDDYLVPIKYEDVDQFGNVAPDGPQYVNGNPAPVQESNVDGCSVPILYEDVGQFGSNTGEYNQLEPETIGVPQQHYSALSTRPNDNNAASAGVYEEIR